MKPLTPSEFRDALRKGKGRAYLHVCRYGDAGVRKALMEACKRDLRYQSDVENDRSDWTYAILAASGHPEHYLKAILRALAKSHDARQAQYQIELTGEFARRGNEMARQTIRARFVRRGVETEPALAEAMMDADGLDGFLQVANAIGARYGKADSWFADYCFYFAKERFGELKVRTAVLESARRSSGMRRFVHLIRLAKQKKASSRPTLRQVLRRIETGRSRLPISLTGYPRRACPQDMQLLFSRMLKETRPKVVYRFLQVFFHTELPRLDPRIFEWARTGNTDVHRGAMVVLSNVKHETVRDLALERLCPESGSRDWWGLSLLERNWVKGDGRWIGPPLPQEGKAVVLHNIGLDLNGIAEAHRDETLAECLLWVYEQTPCSRCRGRAIRNLIRLRRASRRLLREAVHDADGSARRAAARALSRKGNGKVARRKAAQD